jgi:hypothetical protein
MSKQKKKKSVEHKPSKYEINESLVALIASTKRKNRKLSPLEVVEKIEIAKKGIGSLPKVARRIGLSYEMLRQIFSVRNCSEGVKRLIREGKIDSYDILYRLSKLPPSSQVAVAKQVITGDLTSEDVRAIVTFHRDFPGINIRKIIERIKSSRNIKQYVVYFELDSARIKAAVLRSRFESVFGKGSIISIDDGRSFRRGMRKAAKALTFGLLSGEGPDGRVDAGVGELVLNTIGKNRLQEKAKRRGLTKRELIRRLVVER